MSPFFPLDLCFQVSVLIIHWHCLSILAIYFPLCYCLTQNSFQAKPKRAIMLLWGLSSPFKSIFGDLNDKQKSIRTSTCCTFCVYIENKVIQVNCRLNACSSYTFTIFAIKVKEFSNLWFVYLKHVSLVNETDTHLFCVSHRQSNFIMELQVTCSVHLTCIITFADFTYLRGFLFQCIAKWLRL